MAETIFDHSPEGLTPEDRARYRESVEKGAESKRETARLRKLLRLDDEARAANDPRHRWRNLEREMAAEMAAGTISSKFLGPMETKDLALFHGSSRPMGAATLDFRMTDSNRTAVLNELPAVWGAENFMVASGYGGLLPEEEGVKQTQVYYLDLPQVTVLPVDTQAYNPTLSVLTPEGRAEHTWSAFRDSEGIRAAVAHYQPDVLMLTDLDPDAPPMMRDTPFYVILPQAKEKMGVIRVAGSTPPPPMEEGGAQWWRRSTDLRSISEDIPLAGDSPVSAAEPSETFCHAMRQYWTEYAEGEGYGEQLREKAQAEVAYWQERCDKAAARRESAAAVVSRPEPLQPRLAGQGSLFPTDTLPPPASGKPPRPAGAAVKARTTKTRPRSSVPKIARRRR